MRPTCLSDTHSQEGRWEHLVLEHTRARACGSALRPPCRGWWVWTEKVRT